MSLKKQPVPSYHVEILTPLHLRRSHLAWALACIFFLGTQTGFGDSDSANGDEPAAIVEIGGAASHDLKDGASSFGPAIAVEVTPVEKWLELEAGITPLFRRHSTEWDTDLLFKKPWDLSEKVEFMFGVGPEWVHTNAFGLRSNSVAGEAVLDFMFWPSGKHRFGWYIEPAYEYGFGPGHERSFGVTGGLLIGFASKRGPRS